MSMKHTSAEASNDEKTTESSESLLQTESIAKRAKLDSMSDTVLQDLPIELLQCILIQAVVMEVTGLKLAKSVWQEKLEAVISRLRAVCSQWSSILTTTYFRNELQRTLDSTAEATVRLEILHQFPTSQNIYDVTVLKDEIFLLCDPDLRDDFIVCVYSRDNLLEAKYVIPIPGGWPVRMRACNVSNCVYIGLRDNGRVCSSVSRMMKNANDQFFISPWLSDHRILIRLISVTAKGNLIIMYEQEGRSLPFVGIYSANGFLQHEIMMPTEIEFDFNINVIQKSNGNLVVASVNCVNECFRPKLLEIDQSGIVVRQYQSSLCLDSLVNSADTFGRIMIASPFARIDLLDSEFNFLGTCSLKPYEGTDFIAHDVHFDSARNEIVRIHCNRSNWTNGLTIFRFTEE